MLISSSNFSRESRNPNFHVNSFDVDLKQTKNPVMATQPKTADNQLITHII